MMKVAITAQGEQMKSPVDPRFGRAKWFIVIDMDTADFEVARRVLPKGVYQDVDGQQ